MVTSVPQVITLVLNVPRVEGCGPWRTCRSKMISRVSGSLDVRPFAR